MALVLKCNKTSKFKIIYITLLFRVTIKITVTIIIKSAIEKRILSFRETKFWKKNLRLKVHFKLKTILALWKKVCWSCWYCGIHNKGNNFNLQLYNNDFAIKGPISLELLLFPAYELWEMK